MMSLSWDDELAAGAQLWATQCSFAHDANRNVCRFKVGQNLFIAGSQGGTPAVNWQAAIGGSFYTLYWRRYTVDIRDEGKEIDMHTKVVLVVLVVLDCSLDLVDTSELVANTNRC
jgi:hypothetical protein